jgi:hypothetical protein
VTGVVLPDPRPLPEYERVFLVRDIVVLVTAATGLPPAYRDAAWVWTGVDRPGPTVHPSAAQLARCTSGAADGTVDSIQASAACILADRTAS